MIRAFIILTAILFAQSLPAASLKDRRPYYPKAFYEEVENGLQGEPLKKTLFTILSSFHRPAAGLHDETLRQCGDPACYRHTALSYSEARRLLFGALHLEQAGSAFAVRDVYCEHLSTSGEFTQNPPGPGQIPDPAVINAEHTWPQSRFSPRFDRDTQKSDLHILYPALAHANTSRSNHRFNEVVGLVSAPCPLSRRGYGADGSGEIYFEPPEGHKGNVARAVLYFSTRYQLPVQPAEEASLKAWHKQDPPDEFELRRHEKIFAKQKVRNPYIDHPELVELIGDF